MNTQPNNKQLSIIQVYAASRHMEKEALTATLFKTIAPKDATMEDLVGFLQIAHRFDLDPWAKEIYLIKSKGRVSTYVSVDGYARIVNREREYDGCDFTYDQDENGRIIACTCTMYRKDRSRPVAVTEFLDECIIPDSGAWQKSPGRMLRHRAFVQAARLAFGISGALDEGTDAPYSAGPTVDLTPEPEQQQRPAPKKTPPSPNAKPAENPQRDTGQEVEQKKDEPGPQDDFTGGFPMDGFLADLASAKTVEELKAIYQDYDADGNLQHIPEALDRAQEAFIKNQNRIERAGR